MPGRFSDPEEGFKAILVAAHPELADVINPDPEPNIYHVGFEVPVDLKPALPFFRLGWLAGSDDGITMYGVLDVENFAERDVEGLEWGERAREAFRPLPGHKPPRAGSFIVDSVDTQQGPTRLSWPDPTIRRYYASYRVSARR